MTDVRRRQCVVCHHYQWPSAFRNAERGTVCRTCREFTDRLAVLAEREVAGLARLRHARDYVRKVRRERVQVQARRSEYLNACGNIRAVLAEQGGDVSTLRLLVG